MSTTTASDLAEHVIATLWAHETELRQAGIRRLSLFGSVARGDAETDSDVDLAAELDPEAGIGLFALGALERRLADLVGRKVDLLPEPVEKQRLRVNTLTGTAGVPSRHLKLAPCSLPTSRFSHSG